VVIENIGGAGGGGRARAASRSRPDGYTLLLGGATTHITEALLKTKPTYDPHQGPGADLAGRGHRLRDRRSSSVPANNLKELVAYVKANPARCPTARPATARSIISPANCSSSSPD
jgi:tripartite-type tricarboxylate transporter receptor subunit TctC